MQSSFPCIGTSWQPLSMFDIVLAQLGMIHQRTSNKFVETVDVADRYFIKAHAKKKKKKSKKQPFRIYLSVKLVDGRMSIKHGKIYSYLNYNIVNLGKMAGKTKPFSY